MPEREIAPGTAYGSGLFLDLIEPLGKHALRRFLQTGAETGGLGTQFAHVDALSGDLPGIPDQPGFEAVCANFRVTLQSEHMLAP